MRRAVTVMCLVAVAASACGGREPGTRRAIAQRAEQARGVARRAGLAPAVQDFVALYASAPAAHMSVTYAVGAPGSGRIRVDQQPPRRRVDITTGGDPTLRSLFETPTGTYSCERVDSAWTCDRNDSGGGGVGVLDAADINRTVTTLTASRRDFDLRVGHRTLAGKQATCLITTPRAGSTASVAAATSLCVSGQGTPLLIERSGESLRALSYSTHVDDARFRLPSRPRE